MMWKPFKPPLAKRTLERPETIDLVVDSDDESRSRPAKKRRLIHIVEDSPPKTLITTPSSGVMAARKPLIPVKNLTKTTPSTADPTDGLEGYYTVLWRKFQAKKHKTWDGDGVLAVYGGYARLQNIDGRDLGRTTYKEALLPGSTLSIGGKDIEIDAILSKADYLAGKPFLKTSMKRIPSSGNNNTPTTQLTAPRTITLPRGKVPHLGSTRSENGDTEIPAKSFYGTNTHKSTAMKAQFKNPLLSTTVMPQSKDGVPAPRHDPGAPNALVMKRLKHCPKGKLIVDVVMDPFLGQHLHDHQREGIRFLYECVMGMRDFNGDGAILADEMGLGKTLQTIALIWTLLKQNPIHGSGGVIQKALIVCPVTLIVNWKKEFQKWLGNERIGVFVMDGSKHKRLTDFTHGKSYSVCIIGYEKLRSVQDELKTCEIDIIIADEGHRLKTAANKSAQAIRSLNTSRRIILSGTPMQNDLSEFFCMVDFVNPGLLGNAKTFKKEFEAPILASRQPGASEKDIEKGTGRGEELAALTKAFILRRTADVIAKYLPPKSEYVLFCKPTEAQAQVYQHILTSPFFGKVIGSPEASLQLITLLKKVCNAPCLLVRRDESIPRNPSVAALLEVIPADLLKRSPMSTSSKFRVLDRLLKQLSTTTEKIVLVSNYTQTLDLLAQHLTSLSLPFLRLDGSTPTDKRQGLVDTFNKTPASKNFAFLLSAKSGGAGINLIGASRLVLFDVDWNPATDLQAMARIHRHGQKRPVKIYRFLMSGGMDEKIYQRQISKTGLADSVVDGKENMSTFKPEDLRDLFRLDTNAGCQTHDLLSCKCKGLGTDPLPEAVLQGEASDGGDGTSDDSDDEMLFSPAHMIVPGTKANVAVTDKRIAVEANEKRLKQSRGKMQALMSYKHIDTAIFKGETRDVFGYEHEDVTQGRKSLEDDVLAGILEEEDCKVGYVFVKKANGGVVQAA